MKSSIERMLKTLLRATCKSELLKQFRRANDITSLWNNAHMKGLIIFKEDTKDADEDNKDLQYQHWINDEILNFNDDDNED
ncbi:hypothetical protein TNIN_374611 [Trichonephila inaurata madagascariensis]|uniref:Uncharacterized protein n=1 Tax=Trichonephila inaurata madagascariensis TaxID=2747483 RepID=A0A8X7CCX8_9ARAC|nr:hypothetical protein TNIN_374611 [Trichonephila inaurata madagascariensis]